jgi:ribulose-bisphosphate carboxylase large chain
MTLQVQGTPLGGDRFTATYRVRGDLKDALSVARLICFEHTVELPPDIVPPGPLLDHVVGRVVSIDPDGADAHVCTISYAVEMAGDSLPTLLGHVMGNASFFPTVQLVDLQLSPAFRSIVAGPRFGADGVRKLVRRPIGLLSGTALKPMGASSAELAGIAAGFARGGLDVIKEDDGLNNQSTAPFRDRVARCAEAVLEANQKTGGATLYAPNITGPIDQLVDRARFAKAAGAGGVVIIPGLVGLDALRLVSSAPDVDLPIFAHSAWNGALSRHGSPAMSFAMAHGLLPRLAGADVSIAPTFRGRFGLTESECRDAAEKLGREMAGMDRSLSMPGGGIDMSDIGAIADVYGEDCIVLVSGALLQPGTSLEAKCIQFAERVRAHAPAAKQVLSA